MAIAACYARRMHKPVDNSNSEPRSFLPVAKACPRDGRAYNVRRQLWWPRLIREEHENVTREPASARLLDFLLAIGGKTRFQHLIDAKLVGTFARAVASISSMFA